jgi:replicative DNA helicase
MKIFDIESEQALLGCIFISPNSVLPELMNIIQPSDFYNPEHLKLYTACINLFAVGRAIDTLIICKEVPDVSPSYISGLADGGFTINNFRDYVWIIKKFARVRQIQGQANALMQKIKSGGDTEEALNSFSLSLLDKDTQNETEHISEIIMQVATEENDATEETLKTGYSQIDKTCRGLHAGELWTIAADTGKGKTALALNICEYILQSGKNLLYFNLEMSNKGMVKRMLASISGVEMGLSRADMDHAMSSADDIEAKLRARTEAKKKLFDMPFYINEHKQTLQSIYTTVKRLDMQLSRKKKRIDLVVIDYIGLVQCVGRGKNREQEIAEVSRFNKSLAKDFKIPVLQLAQVNRDKNKDKRAYLRIGDLRESAAIEHDSDMILFLNPVYETKDAEQRGYTTSFLLTAGKHRNSDYFEQKLRFIPSILKFEEAEQ